MVMKASVLTKLNAPLVVADIAMPESLAYGQVAVKILVSGICGAQLQEIRGEKGNAAFLPHLLGHEGCGIVDSIGEGVTRVKPGDKVVTSGGLTGAIMSVKDDVVVLRIPPDNIKMEVTRASIVTLTTPEDRPKS
jgi:threonine dehydrogenase-like Zn-dependent dehydrogenase